MSNDHNERMARALKRHIALLEALLGERWRKDLPLHLIILSEIYGLSDEEGMVIDAFITRCKKAMAAYKYTAQDVAARFHTSARTIQRLAQRGDLKGSRIGGRWRFTDKQIARYVEEHTVRGDRRVMV